MCVIIYKPAGVPLSNITDLKEAFSHNSDGAGFCYNDGNKVYIEKGFMTYESLKSALNQHELFNSDLIIHCRIGTSGTNSKKNCHPYPLNSSILKMGMLKSTCDTALAHNGVLFDYAPNKINKHDINDTQLFILRVLNTIKPKSLKRQATLEYLGNMIDSNKLAIMFKDTVKLIGDFKEKNEIFYSNLNHDIKYWYKSSNTWSYSSYKDYPSDDRDLDYYDDLEHYEDETGCTGDCENCDQFECIYNPTHEIWLDIKNQMKKEKN